MTCVIDTTEAVLEIHAHHFDDKGRLKIDEDLRPFSLQGIVFSMVIEERILGTAVTVEKLLEHISHLNKTRTTHRIWLPSRLQYSLSWLFNRHSSISLSGISTHIDENPDSPTDPIALESQAKEAYRRLLFSRGSKHSPVRKGFLSRAIVGAYKWLTNPAGIYALRMVILTIGTAIPAAIPSSAGFYYREKGIWTIITAQTCLVEYTADFTFSLVSRGLGTVVGGILAVVAWYIGAANGPGNPYGLSAITAVITAIIVWCRLFLPPAFVQAGIMLGSTFILIIGFSYDHDHIEQYGLPGIGYEAFWKRLVTVLVGFAASIIVQLFPRPPSATSHVCKSLANTVRTLADHYSLLLSHWGRSEQGSPLGAVAEQISLEVAETLLSLNGAIALLRVELNLGAFDQKVLKKTQEQCQYMNQSLGRLLVLSASLPTELQARLVNTVGLLDDRIIGEVMSVLGIIEQSLRTGGPLPERLPTPLISRFWNAQSHEAMLSKTLVRNEYYRQYCVAISSYVKFLSTIDDLVLLLKGALGECHVIYRWEDA
ncbi:aromatic acid exporter family member 2 domain-containing protein [Hirsutella rhossiliensis]|uniref:Aromatic acid exporter family member 2 domain-containing protein n=1 Tax=Hirsutella rhossiliensis TaxID=111463 RepID=A0A9P8SI66_9HYPO|nr:aromatic acid exporter family member 2 domain-containing protein [Hirsutella rhossiliensis]KAH0961701.1 aromatic acid exporter family member 2 domain-containing protein [Hirsutella rhossiliensis]